MQQTKRDGTHHSACCLASSYGRTCQTHKQTTNSNRKAIAKTRRTTDNTMQIKNIKYQLLKSRKGKYDKHLS